MADSFDPYRKWLAIPPEEQPPHCYRLLAIPLFESDPDVISNAADGRMSQIKNYQTGPHAKLSQQILNQIAAAKVCLLDPKKKAVYDQRLRAKLQPAVQSGAQPAVQKAELDLASLTAKSLPRTAARGKKKKKPQSWLMPAIAAGALVVAAGAAAVVFMMPPASGPAGGEALVAKADTEKSTTKLPSAPAPLPAGEKSRQQSAKPLDSGQAKKADVPEQATHTAPAASKPPAEAKPEPKVEPNPEPAPEPKAEPKPQPKAEEKPAAPSKLPVPTEEQQQATEHKVRDIFQKEFIAANTTETRSALAGKLADEGRQTSNDAAAQYVLCKLAAQEYAAAGNSDKAMEVVDATMGRYQCDVARLKADVLASVLGAHGKPVAVDPDVARGLCEAAMKLSEDAVAAGDVETAAQFIHVASMAAFKAKDQELSRESGKRSRDIDRLKLRFAAVEKALDTLRTDPADAEANLKAGQWCCFVRGQWSQGLPMLAKTANTALAELAKQDLAAPSDAKQQVALADAWWNLAEKEASADKAAIQARARHWYALALDKITGLEKARIQKRVEEESAPEPAAVAKVAPREKAASRETGPTVDVTSLPWTGQRITAGKRYNLIVDNLNIDGGFQLPPPTVPGDVVRHFVFMHATSILEVSLDPLLRSGKTPRRFKAFLYLTPGSRQSGSDGIVWAIEAGNKTRLRMVLTTAQDHDMNPVDVALPSGTTRIVVHALPGAANNEAHDWGIVANPVIVFGRGAR